MRIAARYCLLCSILLALTGAVSAQEEGAKGNDELKKKAAEIKTKQKELYKGLSKFKREVMKDPEVMELKKAFDDKVNEKLSANPEAKKLMDELEALKTEMKGLRPQKPKKEGPPKDKKPKIKKAPKGKKTGKNTDDAMDH